MSTVPAKSPTEAFVESIRRMNIQKTVPAGSASFTSQQIISLLEMLSIINDYASGWLFSETSKKYSLFNAKIDLANIQTQYNELMRHIERLKKRMQSDSSTFDINDARVFRKLQIQLQDQIEVESTIEQKLLKQKNLLTTMTTIVNEIYSKIETAQKSADKL